MTYGDMTSGHLPDTGHWPMGPHAVAGPAVLSWRGDGGCAGTLSQTGAGWVDRWRVQWCGRSAGHVDVRVTGRWCHSPAAHRSRPHHHQSHSQSTASPGSAYWTVAATGGTGQWGWSVWMVSVGGQCDWSVWMVSVDGQCDWSV